MGNHSPKRDERQERRISVGLVGGSLEKEFNHCAEKNERGGQGGSKEFSNEREKTPGSKTRNLHWQVCAGKVKEGEAQWTPNLVASERGHGFRKRRW